MLAERPLPVKRKTVDAAPQRISRRIVADEPEPKDETPRPASKAEREARLAAALRANLRRRKTPAPAEPKLKPPGSEPAR